MKCALLLFSIIASPCFGMNYSYQLPTKETIKDRLNKAGLQEFADQSQITDVFGDNFFTPIGICNIVRCIVEKYNNTPRVWSPRKFEDTYDNNGKSTEFPTIRIVINLLLQEHPRVLTALEKNYDGCLLR